MCVGFFTAIGWWAAENYVIDPYLKPKEYVESK